MLTQGIKFRVTERLRERADRVVKLRSAGRPNRETLSDLGREAFTLFIEAKERELGIEPPNGKQFSA